MVKIQFLDYAIVIAYFLCSLLIGFFFLKRAGKSIEEFFLSGRKLTWWVAGTTMVATTFAADTPLAVTELVALKGIAGNWMWWNMVAGSVLTVFFFSKLWRRAQITTDVEFIEIRYSGKPAAFLRGFKAIYLGIFINCVIMGWVNVALAEILINIFGVSRSYVFLAVIVCMGIVGLYSSISGLWGIVVTDFFQFIIAMLGCIVLAVFLLDLPEIGGIVGLKASLPDTVFDFFPGVGIDASMALQGVMMLAWSAFIAHILIQWWASWYPGSEPGGGGYIAQRMMSTKDERHSVLATLWFTIAHYALRPWPWIIVALATLILYPDLPPEHKKTGFILAMRDHLPSGLLGMLVAAFLAAYMSTISTHLNWGSSYIINDFYKRFIVRESSEEHYVFVSRIVTILLVFLSSLLIFIIESISGAWAFIIECGAGLGLVLILRWYWWRINAWSEIAAMIAPFVGYALTRFYLTITFPHSLFVIVLFTTVTWLVITFLTEPTDEECLIRFYERVQPDGPGWNRVKVKVDLQFEAEPLSALFVNWIIGILLIYSSLFSIGKIILKEYHYGIPLAVLAALLFLLLNYRLRRSLPL